MDKILKDLKECSTTTDLDEIKRCLNLLPKRMKEVPEPELLKYNIDYIIKNILINNPCIEILDLISDVLTLSRTPSIFMDVLDVFTLQPSLAVPTLMLIFEIQNRFDLVYDEFFHRLEATICKNNVSSEGYLIFLLKSLQSKQLHEDIIIPIILKLVDISTEVDSNACIKVLYTIIVILRMHPGCFKIVSSLKKLYIFLESFEPIASIAKRIFLEAETPKLRPSMVFLQNFSFPDISNS